MSERRGKKSVAVAKVEEKPGFVDYSNLKIAKRKLKEAFATYVPPQGGHLGRTRMDGQERSPPAKRPGEIGGISKFNYARCEKILTYLGTGMWLEQVCDLCGVRSKTVVEWIKTGQDPTKGPYYVFASAVAQVSAAFEAMHLANIHNLTLGKDPITKKRYMQPPDSVSSSLRMLKVKFPLRYTERVDVTSGGKTIEGTRPDKVELVFVDGVTATPVGAAIEAAKPDDEE